MSFFCKGSLPAKEEKRQTEKSETLCPILLALCSLSLSLLLFARSLLQFELLQRENSTREKIASHPYSKGKVFKKKASSTCKNFSHDLTQGVEGVEEGPGGWVDAVADVVVVHLAVCLKLRGNQGLA